MTNRATRTAPLQRPADMTNQITNPDDLEVGRWYAIGFANEDNIIEWWKAPLCRYEGNGEWTAEDNEDYTDPIFDSGSEVNVGINQADAFMLQY
jgi:hypothetical protein